MNSDSADADATAAAAYWQDLLDAMTNCSQTFLPQGIHGHEHLTPAYLSPAGSTNFDAVNNMAFTPTPATSTGHTNITQNYSYPNVPSAWSMHANSVAPPLVGDPNWRGVSPLAVYPVAEPPNVVSPSSSATPPASQTDWAWLFEAGQSAYPTPSSLPSGEGLVAPYSGASFNAIPTPSAERGVSGFSWPTPAMPVTSSRTAALGKRRRDEYHGDGGLPGLVIDNYQMPPQKRTRVGEANGIPKATRHKPVARIPQTKIKCESKEAGRGAERLATRNLQGIHHQPLLGPDFQQGWVVNPADGQSVEGSGGEEAVHTDSTAQQQQPKDISPEHRALLAPARGSGEMAEFRCQLCPDTYLKTWDDFKRHCDYTETHPLKIAFCKRCGDYFARPDSLKRHLKSPPAACRRVDGKEAEAKRMKTLDVHKEFVERLKVFMETGEKFGAAFCDIIKELYPDSSKKRRATDKRVKGGLEGR